MDQALLSKLIQSYGAADTPENTNRIRAFYGANPDQAERRVMGMRGSEGQQGAGGRDDILNAMLDKVIAQTNAPAPQQAAPEVSSGMNYGAPPQRGAPVPRVQTQGADPSPSNFGSLPPQDSVPESGGIWPWLIGALGARGVASLPGSDNTFESRMRSNTANDPRMIQGPDQNAKRITYQPKLQDQGGARMPSGAPEIPKGAPQQVGAAMQDPAEVERMKAEVAAENLNAATADEQMMSQMKAQARTRKLGQAARVATGRK